MVCLISNQLILYMRNVFNYIGRFSVIMLLVMVLEGLITFGSAFDFSHYTAAGAIFQCLIVCVVIWVAAEWYYESKN